MCERDTWSSLVMDGQGHYYRLASTCVDSTPCLATKQDACCPPPPNHMKLKSWIHGGSMLSFETLNTLKLLASDERSH